MRTGLSHQEIATLSVADRVALASDLLRAEYTAALYSDPGAPVSTPALAVDSVPLLELVLAFADAQARALATMGAL